MSSNYVPLYIFLGLLFCLGVLLPFFISPFVNVNSPSQSSLLTPFANLINNGLSFNILGLGSINLNFFFWLPQTARTYIANYVNTFTYIPDYLSIPLMTIMVVSLAYTIIKLFWGN